MWTDTVSVPFGFSTILRGLTSSSLWKISVDDLDEVDEIEYAKKIIMMHGYCALDVGAEVSNASVDVWDEWICIVGRPFLLTHV